MERKNGRMLIKWNRDESREIDLYVCSFSCYEYRVAHHTISSNIENLFLDNNNFLINMYNLLVLRSLKIVLE